MSIIGELWEEDYNKLKKQFDDLNAKYKELESWKEQILESIHRESKAQHVGTNGDLYGCSSGACLVEKPKGMHTNSGNCYCSKETLKKKLQKLKNKLYRLNIEYSTNE